MRNKLVIFGSLNMDFVVRVPRLPAPGETTLGSNFQMIPGGKGANQACAVGQLAAAGGSNGKEVVMLGCVGQDVFATQLRSSLSEAGVDVQHLQVAEHEPTGVALIWVDATGQNSIVVASGANNAISTSDSDTLDTVFSGARYALFQLESPLQQVEAALKTARRLGVKTILDPAPAQSLSASLLNSVDIITPNESEACLLLHRSTERIGPHEAPKVAAQLLEKGVAAVVLKLGEQGCFYADHERQLYVPGFVVEVADTTAAGDVFNGAFSVALSEQHELQEALRFANAAAALSVMRMGAQRSVPMRSEVDEFLKSCAS